MSRSHISSNELLITCQQVLRNVLAGTIIPGEQRPNPSLSFLRFTPPRTHILLYRERIGENPGTVGDSPVSRHHFSTVLL